LSQNPAAPAVGQVSADGQFRWDGMQWVPIPRGTREPTAWTRPMQMAVAAYLVLSTLFSVLSAVLFINHDSMVRVMTAQGSLPSGTNVDQVVSIALFIAYAFVIFFAIVYLVVALGSYLGWRWMFWVALVVFGLTSIGAFTNLLSFAHPDSTEVPVWGIAVGEVLSLAGLAIFIWMIVGLIKYGPWALKRPGA
jgi:hypothetical protein